MKTTLHLDTELITNWAYKNGLAKVDWQTEDKNAYNNRPLQNPDQITLEFDVYSEKPQPNVGFSGYTEFHNFHYICDKGKAWPIDVDPAEIEHILIEKLEKR